MKFYLLSSLTLSFLISSISAAAQQSFTTTQYMNNIVPYNSAHATIYEQAGINLSGRSQWAGIDGAPVSYLLNGHVYLKQAESSAGIILSQDKFGVERQTDMAVFLAKSVSLGEYTRVAVSVNGGFQSYKANYSELDPADPAFASDLSEVSGSVGSAILFYNPDRFYAGLSVPRINFHSRSRQLKNTWYLTGGVICELGENIILKPSALLSYQDDLPLLADVSSVIYFDAVGIGMNYRSNKEVAGIFQYLYKNFSIGYSYQTGLSKEQIGRYAKGTHDLGLGIRFGETTGKPQKRL